MSVKNFKAAQEWINRQVARGMSVDQCLRAIAQRCKEKRVLTHGEHCDLQIWALKPSGAR